MKFYPLFKMKVLIVQDFNNNHVSKDKFIESKDLIITFFINIS